MNAVFHPEPIRELALRDAGDKNRSRTERVFGGGAAESFSGIGMDLSSGETVLSGKLREADRACIKPVAWDDPA